MKKSLLFFVSFLLLARFVAFADDNPRILVAGQEIPFQNLLVQNGNVYVGVDDSALPRMAALLGEVLLLDREKHQLTINGNGHSSLLSSGGLVVDTQEIPLSISPSPPGHEEYISLNSLAKACEASLSFDSEKRIWHVEPYITNISLTGEAGKLYLNVQSTGPIQPSAARLTDPERIVLDFPYSALLPTLNIPALPSNDLAREIHVAQFQNKPGIVRVVITLSKTDVQWTPHVDNDAHQFSLTVIPSPPAYFVLPKPQQEEVANGDPSQFFGIGFKREILGNEEQFFANFKVDKPTQFQWHRLKSPDNRIFVDLINCKQGIKKELAYKSNLIGEIRLSQFQTDPVPIVRVTFELKQAYQTEVEPTNDGLRLFVRSTLDDGSSDASTLTGDGTSGAILVAQASGAGALKNHKRTSNYGKGIVVVLDAGHGGTDPGAHGRVLVEKEVTLDIARKLEKMLQEEGFNVLMTRTGDYDVLGYHGSAKAELQARVDVANRANAAVFISLHINSSESSWPHGVQTHWYKAIDLELANSLQSHLANGTNFLDRGILRDRFYVLRNSNMPSVLVEMGFISNPDDESNLASPEVRERLAESLKSGIMEYTNVRKNAHL